MLLDVDVVHVRFRMSMLPLARCWSLAVLLNRGAQSQSMLLLLSVSFGEGLHFQIQLTRHG
jgi:hypothetical protein